MLGELLVVYGSLRDGHGVVERLGLRGRIEWLGACRVGGVLYDMGNFPALREEVGEVVGELVRVKDARTLQRLDQFERYKPAAPRQSMYIRKKTALLDRPGVSAWIYVFNDSVRGCGIVPGGDWTAHLKGRRSSGVAIRRAPSPPSAPR